MLTSHNYSVTSVAWSQDGKLASGSYDKTEEDLVCGLGWHF